VVPLEILREACFNVYEITRKLIGTEEGNQRLGIGAGGDWSRKIDIESEKAIIRTVQKHGLSPTFIGEECGKIPGREGYLIIDPIDGTTNAISGLCQKVQVKLCITCNYNGSFSRRNICCFKGARSLAQ
jgi:fructose-1,6-bisphosphatase/inositol monophosphatase family enzyme